MALTAPDPRALLSGVLDRRAAMPRFVRRLAALEGDHGDSPAVLAARDEASLAQYDELLTDEADYADVPVDLLKAVCWYASGWRQFEPGGRVLTTPAPHGTSWGCMQLNDVWHPDAFPAAMHDPQASIRYAASLLRWLYEQTGGNWHRATIAFFGHDRRAEAAARRVDSYRSRLPWQERLGAPSPVAEPEDEPEAIAKQSDTVAHEAEAAELAAARRAAVVTPQAAATAAAAASTALVDPADDFIAADDLVELDLGSDDDLYSMI